MSTAHADGSSSVIEKENHLEVKGELAEKTQRHAGFVDIDGLGVVDLEKLLDGFGVVFGDFELAGKFELFVIAEEFVDGKFDAALDEEHLLHLFIGALTQGIVDVLELLGGERSEFGREADFGGCGLRGGLPSAGCGFSGFSRMGRGDLWRWPTVRFGSGA